MKLAHKVGLLCSAAFLAFNTTAIAQSKVYIGAQIGYGIPATSDVLGQEIRSNSAKNIKGTIGGGMTAGFNIGYNITEYLAFDLGAQYLLGTQITEHDVEYGGGVFVLEKMKTNQMRLIPSLIVKGGEGKVKPFARFGLLIPVAGKTVRQHESYSATPAEFNIPVPGTMLRQNYTYEFKGQVSLGFDAGIGIGYELSDNICMTAEINYSALRIKTKSGSMTAYSGDVDLNGVNIATLALSNLPTIRKEINFHDELTGTSNNVMTNNTTVDINKAEDQLARRTNFNSIGLKLGLKYGF